MRILVVGVFNKNSTNNGIANGFENAGHDVVRYDYRNSERDYGKTQRDNHIINFCLYDDRVATGKDINLIVFCKCNGVDIRVIRECNKVAKTFLWYMDPLNGNYNDELIEKIKVADYVGVAKWEVYAQAKKLNPNMHFLIEGFDPAWDYPIEGEKKYDVSFIGNLYGDRRKWIPVRGIVLKNRYNVEHSKAVGQSKINLNFTGGGGPSDRVYKILAAGGFLLSEAWPRENYYDKDRYGLEHDLDYFAVDNVDQMIRMCEHFLKHYDEAEEIAQHGYETVQKFSRDNLAKQIVEIVS